MNKFDELLHIFESQKDEIANLSLKVNELEKTNSFLMKLLEKSNKLPPVYKPSLIKQDKDAAIEKEIFLNSKKQLDSTRCDTTICSSVEDTSTINGCTNLPVRHKKVVIDSKANIISMPHKSNFSPDRKKSSEEIFQETLDSLFESENMESELCIPSINTSGNDSNGNENVFNTVILNNDAKQNCVQSVCPFNNFSKTQQLKPSGSQSSQEDLKNALDFIIETLKTRPVAIRKFDDNYISTSEYDSSIQEFEATTADYLESVSMMKNQEAVNSIVDKHAQLKLLLTTEQLKSDLLHEKLAVTNGKQLYRNQFIGKFPGNLHLNDNQNAVKMSDTFAESENDQTSTCLLSELQLLKQQELSRINTFTQYQPNNRDMNEISEIPVDPKTEQAFVKFSAIIKGYLVRTLLKTDKVRNIIITIKDTAHLALSLRQERLLDETTKSDQVHHQYNHTNRRTNHETLSLQHRLVSQLRTALCELHEIFFIWPSFKRIDLIRHFINHLLFNNNYDATRKSLTDSDLQTENSSTIQSKWSSGGKLSSATLKRIQNSTQSYGVDKCNVDQTKSSTQKRQISSNIPAIQKNSLRTIVTPISSSHSLLDGKSRSNSAFHHRGVTRTITKPYFKQHSSNSRRKRNTNSTSQSDNEKMKSAVSAVDGCQRKECYPIQAKSVTNNVYSRKPDDKGNSHIFEGIYQKRIVGENIEPPAEHIRANSKKTVSRHHSHSNSKPFGDIMHSTDQDQSENRTRTFIITNNKAVEEIRNLFKTTATTTDDQKITTDNALLKNCTWTNRKDQEADHNNGKGGSRIEVNIEDFDFTSLCQNNSHAPSRSNNPLAFYDDPVENNIVFVDYQGSPSTRPCQDTAEKSVLSEKQFSRNCRPYNCRNVSTNLVKGPVVMTPIDHTLGGNGVHESQPPFRIRKRIVAASNSMSLSVSLPS